MKFIERNYSSAVAGLIGFVTFMSYTPFLKAETGLHQLVENLPSQISLETVNYSFLEKDLLLVKKTKLPLLKVPLETANFVTLEPGNLSVGENQSTLLKPLVQTVRDGTLEENMLVDEEKQAQLLEPSLNLPEDSDRQDWPAPIEDNQIFWQVLIDQLEYRHNGESDTLNWNARGWIGGDYKRLWVKTEGEMSLGGDEEIETELQVLYSQLIAPYWDFQVGLRYDRLHGDRQDSGRAFAVVGVQGLAPYLFEVDAALFISQEGDLSARLSTEYELLLTQHLILQPEFEANVALQSVKEFGVGSGLNDIELGLRLRYEINRNFAPYVGLSWSRKFGGAADFARQEGESVDNVSILGGLWLMF